MRFFLLAVATIAGLVWSAKGRVEARHQGVALGYEIAGGMRTRRTLEEEIRQLRIDRAALLDPTRLEPIALARGYHVPSPDQVVVIQVEGAGDR